MRKLRTIEMNRLSLEEFKQSRKLPVVVVLDDVRSLYNVGSVFRSCDAFRIEAIYLCGITATPPNAEIHKTALGAENSVDWQCRRCRNAAKTKQLLRLQCGASRRLNAITNSFRTNIAHNKRRRCSEALRRSIRKRS